MPWLVKGLLIALKSKRGRELLFAAGLGAIELARSERARAVYAKARGVATDSDLRDSIRTHAASAAENVKRAARRP